MSLFFFVYLLPLLFALLLAGPYRFHEKTITRLSALALQLPALASLFLMGSAFFNHTIPLESTVTEFTLFSHTFPVIVWIDNYSIAMLSLTHILGLLVIRYSHGYLHLEKGFQRYFSTILFFIFGMYLLCLAGTMDIFFAGWEIVGFSSFLLIAFYRSHTRSIQNACRVYTIYRVCDVGVLLGAVMGHVLWHEASRFSVLLNISPDDFTGVHSAALSVISFFVIFASLGKSAQFPFHNWPARAMEGPTPSSAIFYGALSIHAGVFLLIRTHPIWSNGFYTQMLVGLIGLLTFIFSTIQGKVQPTIKGQIAFASTTQIGLMFIELSLGFKDIVMIHLFCHALYRCFQLLVSPSIVLDSLSPNNEVVMDRMAKQEFVNKTLYTLAMTDFSLDISWRGFNFLPWKSVYRIAKKVLIHPLVTIPSIVALIFIINFRVDLPLAFSAIGLFFAFKAMMVDNDAFESMVDLSLSITFVMVGIFLVNSHHIEAIMSYMFSAMPCLILALMICKKFKQYDLQHFHALGTANSTAANLFMICFMVLAGMPISTAFIGEDILLEELIGYSILQTTFTTLCLMIGGLVCLKIYTRLFMGRAFHEKIYSRYH